MLWIILGITLSYLIGSLPTAYIAGRLLRGIDIRKFGSGNVGATNALRVLGKKAGFSVLLIDALKGTLVVTFVADFILGKETLLAGDLLRIILGAFSIIGHNWTIFLNFKGGKGVATTFGVLIGLSFRIPGLALIFILVILVWLLTFIILRIVSIASILACISLPLFSALFKYSLSILVFGILIALFIILRHRLNLVRFFQGKEPRLDFKKTLS